MPEKFFRKCFKSTCACEGFVAFSFFSAMQRRLQPPGSWPGMEPMASAVEAWSPNTGLPGKSLWSFNNIS